MITSDLPPPERALAIGAHPDDIELHCGATLAKWAARGSTISLLICTDGSKGTWDPSADPTNLAARRQDEQRAAARILGARGTVAFLGELDGELRPGTIQRDAVATWIRRLRPDVVIAHDPWKRYRLHPDHHAAGLLAVEAIVVARDPLFLVGSEFEPHRPSNLLLFEPDEIDHAENVDGFQAIKYRALLAHQSQLLSTMGIREGTSSESEDAESFRALLEDQYRSAGSLIGVERAEAFKRISEL